MRHLWLGLLVLAAFGLAPAPAAAAKRIALVIGNSGYQAVGALPNPMKDASIIDMFKMVDLLITNRENTRHK